MSAKLRSPGFNPISYVGGPYSSTPTFLSIKRPPTTRDIKGYFLGDFWLDQDTNDIYVLMSLEKNITTKQQEAIWVKVGSGVPVLRQFIADTGIATPAGGGLNVLGFQGLYTRGSGNQIEIQLESGLDGQVYIGGGTRAELGYITSTGGTLSITNGPGTIEIASVPGGDLEKIGTDSGVALPSGGTITIGGTTNVSTTAAGAVVTVNLKNDITLSTGLTLSGLADGVMQVNGAGVVTSNKGTDGQMLIGSTAGAPTWANITSSGGTIAVNNVASNIELEIAATGTLQRLGAETGPGAVTLTGSVNVLGGTNMNTAGAGSTLTVNLNNSVTLASGLTLSALTGGVLQNSGAGVVSSSNGTAGQLLISSSSGAPAWADVTSSTLAVTGGVGELTIDRNSAASPCPPFLYVLESDSGSGTLGGTSYFYVGDDVVMTQVFDDGSVFYPGDGAGAHAYFEAPVTGYYILNFNLMLYTSATVGTITPDIWLCIETPSRDYYHGCNTVVPSSTLITSKKFSAFCDLTALDKVYFKVMVNAGTTAYIKGDLLATYAAKSWIGGLLVEV